MSAVHQGRQYKPGDAAPASGIYQVVHGSRHREPHTVIIIRGEQFPPCCTCKLEVSFEMVWQASHLTHDWDLAGPLKPTDPILAETPPDRTKPVIVEIQRKPVSGTELRALPRYHCRLPVTITLPRQKQALAFTRDIGMGGLFFSCPFQLEAGMKIKCVIRLPPESPLAPGARICYS